MIVKFHFQWPDGTEDQITITGEDADDIKSRADIELNSRSAREVWSEVISE